MKTYLTYIIRFIFFVCFFPLGPHILSLLWPCRSIEPFIRFKSRNGSPCSMPPLGSVHCRREKNFWDHLTIICTPTWGTELCSTLLNTKHRQVQVTDPAGCPCRRSLWASPTGKRSEISPFKNLKKNWQQGNFCSTLVSLLPNMTW